MTETPEQTGERRAEALCKFVFGRCDCPEGKCEDDGQLEKARAIRASDEAAGMVLVPRDELNLVRAVLAQMLSAGHNQLMPMHEDIDKAFWSLDAMIAAHEKEKP